MTLEGTLDAIGNTPLIALPIISQESGGRILAKWEGANPTGSMKDRMALAMVEGGTNSGDLQEGQRVVEFTGGSTGSSLAFVCAVKGHPVTLLSADCFSEEKLATMRAYGADLEVFETPEGKVHPGLVGKWRQRVTQLVEQKNAYWTNQMASPHQLDGYAAMAQEILSDCPDVTDFVMSVGTAGCAMGVSKALKQAGCDAHITLVEPAESPYLTKGEGGVHGVEGIAVLERPPLLDDALYQDVLAVPEAEGRETARRLATEEGLLTGVSSGLNVAASMRVAKKRGKDAVVVTVAVDTGLKYLAGDLFARP